MDEFAHDSDVPVLVTYQQYYDWVAGLVRDVTARFHPDGPVLVELPRPLGVPMPSELLAQSVLISDNISREVEFWRQTPVEAFCEIRVRVRRDRHDFGENSLGLALHSRRENAGAWQDFIANSPLLTHVKASDEGLSVISTIQ
jgi:hypothetical protein